MKIRMPRYPQARFFGRPVFLKMELDKVPMAVSLVVNILVEVWRYGSCGFYGPVSLQYVGALFNDLPVGLSAGFRIFKFVIGGGSTDHHPHSLFVEQVI